MKKYADMFTRYLILILVGLSNLAIFYLIFTPLTIYPVYQILKIFFDVSLIQNFIFSETFSIQIIEACVAGSAYYFLLILNLSTPNIKIKKRINLLLTSFLILLLINILRIVFITFLLASNSAFFEITHKIFWYLGSTIFVVAIWFVQVNLYNIKHIPLYSDIKNIIKEIK